MKTAKLFLVIALTATASFATINRYPLASWQTPGEDEVFAIAANYGIVAVGYANTHGNGPSNQIQLYRNPGSGWQLVATLTISDATYYATSIINSSYIVVGAFPRVGDTRAAYVFTKGAGWHDTTEKAKLLPSNPTVDGCFGSAVATWGPTVVVTAPCSGANGEGTAYVYERPASGWANATETAELETTNPSFQGSVGYSVAITGAVGGGAEQIVLSAPSYNTPGFVYVFMEPSTGWVSAAQETAHLTNSAGQVGDDLGWSVAVAFDGTVIAGAPHALKKGALEIWTKPSGGWISSAQPAVVTNSYAAALGFSVGVTASGGQILPAAELRASTVTSILPICLISRRADGVAPRPST